ncbi:MAG: NUDIX hydrolase [Deltaproteobacteria bacterium]|nr:MAG: NUDIX hydrolase [Deltaproteobacteria bacterium]
MKPILTTITIMMQPVGMQCTMKRKYPSMPIPAVAGVIFSGDRVLVVKRANPPSKGQWSLPGGAVKIGETCEDALRREIDEEVGLGVKIKALVEVVDKIFLDDQGRVKYHYIILEYLAEHVKGRPRACSDAMQVKWVDVAKLSLLGLGQDTIRVIDKAWKMRAK